MGRWGTESKMTNGRQVVKRGRWRTESKITNGRQVVKEEGGGL